MSASAHVVPINSGFQIARYDEMCRAIRGCHDVDEVRGWQNRAAASEAYARMARDMENERLCREIRVRAERRCGELLAQQTERAGRGRPDKTSQSATLKSKPTLEQLGISRHQSSEYQKLAKVPEEEFELALADRGAMPSTRGIIAQHEAKQRDAPKIEVDPMALWLWGALREFERNGVLGMDPNVLVRTMLDHMKDSTRDLAPRVAQWLRSIRP